MLSTVPSWMIQQAEDDVLTFAPDFAPELGFSPELVVGIANGTNVSSSATVSVVVPKIGESPVREVRITLYALIFLLSVVGNSLVIVTLVQNKRMRTVTNVFLLNLAVSDLLLGVFCMPFTLVGSLLRDFIFGEVMCKTIPYFQAVSVSVSVWTLVAISLERFFAICQPLRSRRWQTLSHAYKMIAAVWLSSFAYMTPIASLSQLQPLKTSGRFKCRENWPNPTMEKAFNIFLDILLLVLPLIIMVAAYSKITNCLKKSLQTEKQHQNASATEVRQQNPYTSAPFTSKKPQVYTFRTNNHNPVDSNGTGFSDDKEQGTARSLSPMPSELGNSAESLNRMRPVSRHIRSTNFDKSAAAKKRVIRMLFVLVLEFFLCWTPLYIVNTVSLFDATIVYSSLGATGVSFFHLLAYSSSCCNPITYCFMNRKFRQAFLQAFGCGGRCLRSAPYHSSTNGMSFYNRHSTIRTTGKLSPLISPV